MAQGFDKEQLRDLTKFAKTEARRLGFSLVGVTSPVPPPHVKVYEKWLKAGRHGEMAYLETDRARRHRANPREILPECESILALALNYLPQKPARSGVAAYAVGDDYHDVLVDRLKQLISAMEERLGREIKNRYYTDTGPLLERELAQRAGLGWIGKNTCLISPQHGSYFFLAELLLDLPLEPDEPIKTDHCGECTLCIEACPTECILPDRTLDATRCISYLTIELKGAVPDELRPLTNDWIFGCDICQQVCPWNLRFAEPTTDLAFQARPYLRDPLPRDFLQLSPDGYRRQLSKSPLKRAKHAGLQRNAALAAANSEDRSSIPDLVRILSEEADPIPRAHAAWALGRLGEVEALRAAREKEQDSEVLVEIRSAIQRAEAHHQSAAI
ncbi:MAG: tRNA epoxyqueuosine(34) reductase QueG [Anaerolineales bacterium]